jgi:GntR family transcriptional repressor for pyruvate dehydrogenase complex
MSSEQRRTMSERIAGEIRTRILRRELQPGERLPPERELAEVYETNRNTLREAIRMLEMEGLLRVRHGSGVLVKDYHTEGHLSLLPHVLAEMSDPEERLRELNDLMVFRQVVMTQTTVLAAERATPTDVEALRAALRAVESAPRDDLIEAIRRDLTLYITIAEVAGSHVVRWTFAAFSRMYEQAIEVIAMFWVFPDNYLESLTALVDAIADHRPDDARRILLAHLQSADDIVRETVRSLGA